VWIGPAGITRWNRYITQLLPFSGLIRNAAAAGSDL
jgi:polysaccharide export outer membrane protein